MGIQSIVHREPRQCIVLELRCEHHGPVRLAVSPEDVESHMACPYCGIHAATTKLGEGSTRRILPYFDLAPDARQLDSLQVSARRQPSAYARCGRMLRRAARGLPPGRCARGLHQPSPRKRGRPAIDHLPARGRRIRSGTAHQRSRGIPLVVLARRACRQAQRRQRYPQRPSRTRSRPYAPNATRQWTNSASTARAKRWSSRILSAGGPRRKGSRRDRSRNQLEVPRRLPVR
jgi:hypothetical protein